MDRDRRLSYLILKDVAENESWSNLSVGAHIRKEGAQSPAFVREIVYGVIRNQNLLDFNIDSFLKKPKIKTSERILLRMGFYQMAFMSVSDYAAINETVAIAKSFMKGSEGFINAVLRNFQRSGKTLKLSNDVNVINRYSVNYSVNKDIAKLLVKSYGEAKTEEILKVSCQSAPLTIRVNKLKTSEEDLITSLNEQGFELRTAEIAKNILYVIKGTGLLDTQEYKKGFFSVQGEASAFACEILDPKPGESLIDLCAAPGGKTTYCAELMENKGEISAFDIYPHRVELIKKQAERLGISIINASVGDASVLNKEMSADCVLADVPCSGLGTLRRNPEIKLKKPQIPDCKAMLENAASYSKDRLVFSTCTINPLENDKLVADFLAAHKDWNKEFEKQFFPTENGPDGFYICLLKRVYE